MPQTFLVAWFVALLTLAGHCSARAQTLSSPEQVLDRIVAHIEDDILFESELRELGQFQKFSGSQTEDDGKLLGRLIDQWIVNTEAASAHFSRPTDAEVDLEIANMGKLFAPPETLETRLKQAGLDPAQLHRLVKQQLYLTRYLDYKFRGAVQIPQTEIENYYRQTLAPQLAARGQAGPPLQSVEDEIREVLVQREINLRADRWLEETRAHLRIERNLDSK
ncbi:MAG TPA: hypothetical protein VOA41_18890 [Candidatus Dormibacteraeota bacterium]|nr:hypothetical protein [Candidatus Dormibacteraeota bacterium]